MDFFLYTSISVSCESMIRYTADLGKCFWVLCPMHIFWVFIEKYHLVGDSVLRGDAIIRVMIWVLALHIQVQGTCGGVLRFYLPSYMFHTVVGK